ncbi:LON peptidase substrate-binding domain-containing protein [Egicoccus sp. AB-alg6-2]|uniref:LON peptidase substrate-binding domain-containing protein n=1 Tax=Egicoccus sp. AB-alg6-2 TaxID=3242692 RepID=UPI00359DEAF5
MAPLPMFPLGTVLLPHMLLPLHVFEPRYRTLMQHVLGGHREFGVTLISRGHEVGGGDQRYDVGTVARVLQAEELDDGRWLTVALGTRRVRVRRWLQDDPYPRADVDALPDGPLAPPEVALRDVLADRLRRILALQVELGHDDVDTELELADDPAVACWQLAVLAPLSAHDAQRVLQADGWGHRLGVLDGLLDDLEQTLILQRRHGG